MATAFKEFAESFQVTCDRHRPDAHVSCAILSIRGFYPKHHRCFYHEGKQVVAHSSSRVRLRVVSGWSSEGRCLLVVCWSRGTDGSAEGRGMISQVDVISTALKSFAARAVTALHCLLRRLWCCNCQPRSVRKSRFEAGWCAEGIPGGTGSTG